jgi:hypothetical protein
MTMNRHQRRSDISRFRRDASSALLTYLVEPDDGALNDMPLLKATARSWLDHLSQRIRHCIICSSWLVNREHVGLLLLATPATAKPTSASCCAICRGCADAGLPTEALERAAEHVLREALPGERFEPLDTRR